MYPVVCTPGIIRIRVNLRLCVTAEAETGKLLISLHDPVAAAGRADVISCKDLARHVRSCPEGVLIYVIAHRASDI